MRNDEYSITEAAELLQVHRVTLWDWVKAGKVPARRTGLGKTSPWAINAKDLLEVADKLSLTLEIDLDENQQR